MRTVFRRLVTQDLNKPILDSPVLDDLTVRYIPLGGTPVLSWGEAE